MAMDAKQDFMRTLEQMLSDSVTVSDMNAIMKATADVLEGFEMRNVSGWTDETDDCLNCFLSALTVECRSQKTIDRYRYIIGRLMEYAKVPTRKVTVYHLRSYLQAEKERGISDRTLEGYREIFSSYFNWLQRESLIERNPTANLGAIKCAKKEKKTYTPVDLEKLNTFATRLEFGVRNRAIINFLSSTGCRISEMCDLNRDSVDLEALECVVHGKGNKERFVYLSDVAGMLLGEYLATRTDSNPALFVNNRGERLHPGGVRCMLNKVAAMSGVEHVHPHKFRRTLATELARHGMAIQEVANILGHEKIDTTMQYVVLNKESVKNSYKKFA